VTTTAKPPEERMTRKGNFQERFMNANSVLFKEVEVMNVSLLCPRDVLFL
jgi:hypothetical protein